MPRKLGVLAFSVFLLLASFAARWYGTGGTDERLQIADPRVVATLDYLSRQSASKDILSDGTVIQAWASGADGGYDVNIALDAKGTLWLAWVRFDAGDSPVSSGFRLWSGMLFPNLLRNLSIVFFALWILAEFVAPHIIGVKCPDCPPNLVFPPLTEAHEVTVYPGGFTSDGNDLREIVRRDYICPRCGYRKITYYLVMPHSGHFKTGLLRRWTGVGQLLNPKELDWYDRVLNKNLADREAAMGLRFPTYDEWKRFYDELKASEREERNRRG
ncbi:MAG: hypothetical protein ACOX5M_02480 [Bacillota bacterium]